MTVREEIQAIFADAEGDKPARVARLKAARLRGNMLNRLPFTWQLSTRATVIVKDIAVVDRGLDFTIDLTIRGKTKTTTQSLSTWIEGQHSTPDYRVINPPLFVDDPAGDVVVTGLDANNNPVQRRGRDDLVAALQQGFLQTFGAQIEALVRSAP